MPLFDEPSRRPLPITPELADHRAAVIRGGLSAIPVLGSVLAEELGLVLAPPLTRRRDEWLEDLARRLHDLETRVEGFTFDDLVENEQFVSATLQATQAALRTHQKEKLEALRNAVLNVAAGRSFSDELQSIFLSLLDRLQATHLRILKIFRYPPVGGSHNQWQQITIHNPGTPTRWIKEFVPGLKIEDTNLIRMLISDLYSAGLSFISPDAQNMPLDYTLITGLGIGFLNFITEPRE